MAESSPTFRRKAAEDIAEAAFCYKRDANEIIAGRFIDQTQRVVEQAGDFPYLGSPVFGRVLPDLDLSCAPVEGFPYLVFYIATTGGIEAIRVLHKARDIPTHLQKSEDD